jgi:hypothetical protein
MERKANQRVFDIEDLRKDLNMEYQARIAPFEKEEVALNAELQKSAESTPNLVAVAEARIRLLERTYDEKTAAGDIEAGAAIRQEIEAVTANVTKLSGRAEEIYKRLQAIEKEKLACSNKALAVVYPTMQAYTFAALGAAMDILDGAAGLLDEYARDTGARVSVMNQRNALRPYGAGRGKELYSRITQWFHE